MHLRLLYAAVILCFLAVHGIAIQKLNALTPVTHTTSIGTSGD